MTIFRQISNLARHSAVYAISTVLQQLPGFILLPIYTNFDYIPSQDAFSDYVVVFTFIAFMNLFYLYGMDSALMRYFFLGNRDRKTVFSSTFYILVITSLLSTALIITYSAGIAGGLLQNAELAPLIRLAGWILLSDALGNLGYLILRAEEKSGWFTVFKSIRFLLEVGLNVLFVAVWHLEVMGIFYTSLVASVINFVLMLPIIVRYLTPRIDLGLWKEMLKFGLPLLPNGIAFMTIEMIDRILVPMILSKAALASYGANYRFGKLLLLVVIAFRNAWQPFFLKIANQPNARQIYSRVLTYYIIGGGMIVLTVSYFIRDGLTHRFFGQFYILSETAYWDGIGIIPLILLSYFFYGIYVILTPGFYIRKKSQYMILFTGSGAIVNVVANLILLPALNSFWGAAWATLLSYLVMALTIYLMANRIYPIPLDWPRILSVLGMLGGMLGVYYGFDLSFISRTLLLTGALLVCIFGIINRAERRTVLAQLKRWRAG